MTLVSLETAVLCESSKPHLHSLSLTEVWRDSVNGDHSRGHSGKTKFSLKVFYLCAAGDRMRYHFMHGPPLNNKYHRLL